MVTMVLAFHLTELMSTVTLAFAGHRSSINHNLSQVKVTAATVALARARSLSFLLFITQSLRCEGTHAHDEYECASACLTHRWCTCGVCCADVSMRKSASLRYGVEAKIIELRETLQSMGYAVQSTPEDTFELLLRSVDFSTERALDKFLSEGLPDAPHVPVPETTANPRASPSLESMDTAEGTSAKRPRADPGVAATIPEPFTKAALGSSDPAIAAAIHGLSSRLDRLKIELPAQLALAVPAAVRTFDEEEAARIRANATETALGSILDGIARAKSMEELGNLKGFRYNRAENILICNDCYRYSSDAPPNLRYGIKSCGVIQGMHATRGMYHVRHVVKSHVCNEWHAWCEVRAAEQRHSDTEQRNAGINCGKLVLACVKEHDSDLSYERRITNAKGMGVTVGTKQHSRMFVPKLRHSMHAVLVGGFTKLLTECDPATKRPRPFAMLADKATVLRQTGQMHGLITMIDGELTAIFLSTLLAPDASGKGLARLLWQAMHEGAPLKLSKALIRLSLTGNAFDGQYQSEHEGHAAGLQVQSHLCQLAGLNVDWVTSRWDGAHRIELGMDTVRAKVAFYKALAQIVADAQQKYLYGKGYERVKGAAAEIRLKLASIGVVCTTRFCSSERKVRHYLTPLIPMLPVHTRIASSLAIGLQKLLSQPVLLRD